MRAAIIAVAALAAGMMPVSGAAAAPADDYQAVFRDWQPDQDITICRFSRTQLVNARDVARTIADFESYAPGFNEELARELARHDSGGCRGVAVPPSKAQRNRSRLRSVRIVGVRPKGGARESVTIRNAGRRAVSLRGATLRDRSGHRLRLSGKLGGRRSLRVFTGCAAGRRSPARIGSRLFACRSGRLWDDRGDVVKLVDSRGVVVAQRGFGTLRPVARF
jgi:hypothetical protein